MKLLKKRQSELSVGLLQTRNSRNARVGLGLVKEFWFKISSRCRGVMYSTRSNLAFYSQDFDVGNPLLPQSSLDLSKSGLKKRPSKASSGAYTMGTEGQLIEARPLPDIVVKVGAVASHSSAHYKETHFSVACQITIPFFIAGLGMVLAGIYLDMAQRWKVFIEVPEIIVMVPALLGLKGNLEMTLASRLSTEANLGNMDNAKEQWSMIIGNLTLVQCQAIIIGMLSSWVAVGMVAVLRQEFNIDHVLLLCACSMITASVASFILGLITSCVIVISRWCNINPDNVATPIAGSLGDITSLALLSWVATFLYESVGNSRQISIAVIICYVLVMPFWVWFAKNNKYTSTVLYNGWTPVIIAMLISTAGGLILDIMVTSFKGLAVYQPVINGVGGNLVSIQASRLSTALHKDTELGILPPATNILISPLKIFFAKAPYALTARVLMMLVVPGHIAFLFFIYFFQPNSNEITFIFMSTYLCAAILQVGILLFLAYVLTNWFWVQGIDPDNSTIPYLTAIGDLLGITFLGLTFKFLCFLDEKEEC